MSHSMYFMESNYRCSKFIEPWEKDNYHPENKRGNSIEYIPLCCERVW